MTYYLDKEQIHRLASSGEVYRRGVQYLQENRIQEIEFDEDGDEESNTVKTLVLGNYSAYKVEIVFSVRGILERYRCNCDAFGVWRGGCKHVVSVLLKLFEMNRTHVAQSRLSKSASGLLSVFEQQALDEIDLSLSSEGLPVIDSNAKVELKPYMCSGGAGEIYLTFTIGRKRMYVIKNLFEFVNRVANGAESSYGKAFTLTHKKSMFSTDSQGILDLVMRESDNLGQLGKGSSSLRYFASSALSGRSLPLSKRGLDDFFDLCNGKQIDAGINGIEAKTLRFSTELPCIGFNLNKLEQGVEMTADKSVYQLFEGEGFDYIAQNDTFHRVPHEYYKTLVPIKRALINSAASRLVFLKQEYGRLSTFLIPKLKKFGMLEESPELLADFKEYELIKKAYVDAEDGEVTCRLMFCYGSMEINAINPGNTAFTRDITEEYRCKNMLTQMGFITAESQDKYRLRGDDLIYDFYKSEYGIELLRKYCEVYCTDEFLNRSVKPSGSASFGLRINGGILEVSINTDGYSREELLDVLQSYRLKKRYHRLHDGSFVSLEEDNDGLGAAAELISGLGISDKDVVKGNAEVPKFRALYAEQILNKNHELEADRNKAFNRLTRDFNSYKNLDFDIPPTLENTLRGYQKEGFNWLKILRYYGFGGVLADDMGLGKTLQVITVILSEKLELSKSGGKGEQKPSIVVAPTSLIYNWEKEFRRFAPEINVTTIAGTAAKRKEVIEGDTPDVYITTYDMLKRDVEHYRQMNFQYIIADEAQNIKNPLTQNAKSLKELNGETRFALTGTPIENSLSEIWSIFDFVMPGYLFHAAKFSKHYESPILRNNDDKKAAELRSQLAPFILRRLKRDVLKELPEKIETTLYAEMPPEQHKIYTAYLYQAKGELEQTINAGKYKENQIEILSMLTRLRQICCHPATFIESYEGGSGKLNLTAETVENYIEGGHRLLIFSQFTKMLAILQDMLTKSGIEYFYLDGSTPSLERMNMAERFNNGFGSVFLISLKAGGTGLNLTGADVVIHYDPWWNPAVMDQAADRAHRFGQRRTVQVINIVAKDSIEEKILALQAKKKDLVDTVITEGANFINKMSEEDILELFRE